MEDQEGPSTERVPATTNVVCNGCKHLDEVDILYGHNFVEKGYACNHQSQDYKEKHFSELFGLKGRVIDARTRNHTIHTPDWCPVLAEMRKPKNP